MSYFYSPLLPSTLSSIFRHSRMSYNATILQYSKCGLPKSRFPVELLFFISVLILLILMFSSSWFLPCLFQSPGWNFFCNVGHWKGHGVADFPSLSGSIIFIYRYIWLYSDSFIMSQQIKFQLFAFLNTYVIITCRYSIENKFCRISQF